MAFNAKGELYVADRVLDAVYVFDTNGKYLRKFRPDGRAEALQGWSPLAVTFGPDGRLYLSDVRDTTKHRMLVFDPTGDEAAAVGQDARRSSSAGEKPGDFYFPNGIAVASDGHDLRRRRQQPPRPGLRQGGQVPVLHRDRPASLAASGSTRRTSA